MPYEHVPDDDGFVCDGEWVSRGRPHSVAEQQWRGMEEWQEQLDRETEIRPVGRVELEGIAHGGGGGPASRWRLWRKRR